MPATANYGWVYPVVGANLDDWGDILNASGVAIDAEMFKKANISNPVFTGNITAPAFIGDPSAILRPKTDGATAIQFQNAAGTPIGVIDTTLSRLTISGSIVATSYRGASVVLQPTVDSTTGVRIISAAGAGLMTVDTTNSLLFLAGRMGITNSGTDDLATISISKPSGGQAKITLSSIANTSSHISYAYGSQQWLIGTGLAVGGIGSFDFFDSTGSFVPLRLHTAADKPQVSITGRLVIGPDDGLYGSLNVNGTQSPADSSQSIGIVARFTAQGSGAFVFDTRGVINASGYRRGFYWGNSQDNFGIARYPNSGAGPMIQDVHIDTIGRTGFGTGAPTHRVTVRGSGVAEQGVFSTNLNQQNAIAVVEDSFTPYSGGALILGTATSQFTAIRAHFTDGTGNGVGNMAFFVRLATNHGALTEVFRINAAGQLVVLAMQTANPGAGSKQLWADPADGFTVKFAA